MAISELEAVNRILAAIGEAPVESFATEETNTTSDAALALSTLREVAKAVQAEGWSWNTDKDVDLTKTGANIFTLPATTLRAYFSPEDYPDRQLVARGLRVYDRLLQTSRLPDLTTVRVHRLVRQLDWDELPHQAQEYVTVRAARIHAARFLNSDQVVGYTINDEQLARARLARDEAEVGNYNMLWAGRRQPYGVGYRAAAGRRYRMN